VRNGLATYVSTKQFEVWVCGTLADRGVSGLRLTTAAKLNRMRLIGSVSTTLIRHGTVG
jgi:hypothetical protein